MINVLQPPEKARSFANPLSNAYVLLFFTTLFWAGNTIAGRLAVGHVSPMGMTALRWIFACALMALFLRDEVKNVGKILRQRPWYLLLMALIGLTGFNAIYYIAAHYTTAINLGIMQASTPIFVMLGAVLFQGTRISMGQFAGLVAGIIGVLIVVSAGRIEVLKALNFNIGDVMILIVSAFYAAYSLLLRQRPAEWSGLSFFAALACLAAITSLPLLAWEITSGRFFWPTPKGWLIIAYVAVFPSLLAQIWFIKGVQIIGAARTGFLFNAIPVFSAIMAVFILGEPFGWYHAVGLCLVLGGIAWAERYKG